MERLGGLTLIHVALAGGGTAIVQIEGSDPSRAGETIRLAMRPGTGHVFDSQGLAHSHRVRHPMAA